ncbi:MAG: acyl-CoA thioesterase [Bacteroidales bacterium]|nr:acyl-CoA thioesterase [Bacteroidales bacterium]
MTEKKVFSCPIQIRMSDLDVFNHVNNGFQMNLYDYGRTQFFEHVMQQEIDWLKFDMVIVHVELDFKKPILIHDKVVCETEVVRVGHSSVTLKQRMINTETGQVLSECGSVLVCIDREKNVSKPIPDEVRKLYE